MIDSASQKFRAQPMKYVGRAVLYAVVLGGAVLFALPFVWMIRTSVMPPWQIFIFPPQWIPAELHWTNWATPWTTQPFGIWFKNTFILAFSSTLGTVLSTSIVAYAFARIPFRGRERLFMVILATMMLPPQVTLIPRYVVFSRLGWIDSLKPLVVPQWLAFSAYNVFLLRQYMMTIPLEYDEAATIDGCSLFGIYWRIILPLSAPAMGVIAISHFTWAWNEFLNALIYLNTYQKFTISIGLRLLQAHHHAHVDWAALMAATLQSTIPVLVLFFAAQRYFIQGVVITGVKG
jgi:ABC-type glycerol-3-phosphate transport system permease component